MRHTIFRFDKKMLWNRKQSFVAKNKSVERQRKQFNQIKEKQKKEQF